MSFCELKGSNQTVVPGNLKLATEYRQALFLATEHAPFRARNSFPRKIRNLIFPSLKINIWFDPDGLICSLKWCTTRLSLSSKALWRISHPSPNSFSEYVLICKIVFRKFVDKDNDTELTQYLSEKNSLPHILVHFSPFFLTHTGFPRRQCKRILQPILLFSRYPLQLQHS